MCSSSHYSSKSSSHFFTTTFTFLLVLVLLPFIPSQPPHFVKDTIFTAFWELIYLFVVGIVVCYGLFSRRNGQVENVGSDVSASCGSRISYVSSFFDNAGGNVHGFGGNFGERFDFDEVRECRSSRLRKGVGNADGYGENFGESFDFDEVRESRFSRLRKGVGNADGYGENFGKRFDFDEVGESRFSRLRNGVRNFNGAVNVHGYVENFGKRFDFDEVRESRFSRLRNGVCEENVGKEGNSQCFVGESVVFVGNGNYEVKPGAGSGYRPLNLPVRSLKSRIVDCGSHYEDANLEGGEKIKKVKFRGLVPINLDDKFRETIVSSPIPWGSRFGRMGLRENVGEVKATFVGGTELVRPRLPNVKPLATAVQTSEMGEFERKESLEVSFPPASEISLAQLKSKSSYSTSNSRRFRAEVAVEKNVGDVKPTFVGEAELERPRLPTVKPLSAAVLIPEMEECKRKECLRVSFPPALKSSLGQLKSKSSSSRSSSRRFSYEVAVEKNAENNLKGFSKGETEEDLLNLDVKPATLVNARSISGSFSESALENKSKNDFKGLCKGKKEDSMCKQNKCSEFSNLDERHARLDEGQLQNGLNSEMSYETSSDNNKGSEKSEKGGLLTRENMSDDFWNLDLNSVSLVDERCSTASSSEINGKKKSETISMDFGNHKKGDLLRSKKNGSINSLEQCAKPKTVKCLTRGKSVRTIRSNEISVEVKRSEEVYSSHIGDRFVKHCDEDEAGIQQKSDWIDGLKIEADDYGRKNRDKPSVTKTSESRKNRIVERQKNGTSALVKSESIFVDSENFQVIADEEERRPGIIGDTHVESNEVDKKASEFIAKFREQIRLQKVALKR